MSEAIYTTAGVIIGGVIVYEYSMWRTKRYIKKLVKTELPEILPTLLGQNSFLNVEKENLGETEKRIRAKAMTSDTPLFPHSKLRKSDDYE